MVARLPAVVNRFQQSPSRFSDLREVLTKRSVRVCPLLRAGFFWHPASEDNAGGLPIFGGFVSESGQENGGLF
jgi:hypothetical protein